MPHPTFDMRSSLSVCLYRNEQGEVVSGYRTVAGVYDNDGVFVGKPKLIDQWLLGAADKGRIFPMDGAVAAWVVGIGLKTGFPTVADAQTWVDSVGPKLTPPPPPVAQPNMERLTGILESVSLMLVQLQRSVATLSVPAEVTHRYKIALDGKAIADSITHHLEKNGADVSRTQPPKVTPPRRRNIRC